MLWLPKMVRACLAALLLVMAGAPAALAESPDEGLRLQQIGYRLARANADACPDPAMLDGLVLHDIAGFAPEDRDAARSEYGLGRGFGVIGVVGGSMAERAGLRSGDELVALNGRDLGSYATSAIGNRATYARTEAFVTLLGEALRTGSARLAVVRDGKTLPVTLTAERGCGGRMALMHQRSIDAWSDGRYVAVSEGLAEAVPADEELAFIVAHEMAHNILGHADRAKNRSRFFLQFGLGAGQAKAEEIAADRLAVALMARGGFDPAGAERVLRRVARLRPQGLSLTHPSFSRRIDVVRSVPVESGPR